MNHHLLSLIQSLYVVCFAILKSFICKNVQSEKALGENRRENLSVRTFEVTMLTKGVWLLMLTGNEFWQDFWETYETSSKYELPQVDSTNLHLFTVLQCQKRAIPTFRRTDRFIVLYSNMATKTVGRQGVLYLKPVKTSPNDPCISYFVET